MPTFLMAFLLLIPIFLFAQSELILIEDNGKYGYINTKGEVVIPAKFQQAYSFKDSLAAAREHGSFGVINKKGEWVYQPIYDLLEIHSMENIKAWRNGKQENIRYARVNMVAMGGFGTKSLYGYHTFQNDEGKFGVKRDNGEVVISAQFYRINIEKDDLFNCWSKNGENVEYTLVDTLEQVLIPHGRYDRFKPLGNSWIYVKELNTLKPGLLNINSKSYYPITDVFSPVFYGDGSEGVFPFSNTILDPKTSNNIKSWGFMDTTGQILFLSDRWSQVYTYDQGVAIVVSRKEKAWCLLNKKGEKINNQKILKVVNGMNYYKRPKKTSDFFYKDWAFVEVEEGIARMNRKGEVFLIEELRGLGTYAFIDNRFLMVGPKKKNGKIRDGDRGVFDVLEQKRLPIYADKIHFKSYDKTSFLVTYKGRSQLVTKTGKVLWAENEKPAVLPFDVTRQVHLKMRKQSPRKLHWIQNLLLNKPRLYKGFRDNLFEGKYESNNLYVINPSKDTLVFGASSKRIHLKLEALDTDGIWKQVNICYSCDFTKMLHIKELPPGHYWYFRLPKFMGFYQTKLRATVSYWKKGEPDKKFELIKKFKGGINPGQFGKIY